MRETDPNKMSNTEWERWAEARIAELVAENQRLAADRNAWRECAERLGRQVASLTHNIPTDIPLLGGGE